MCITNLNKITRPPRVVSRRPSACIGDLWSDAQVDGRQGADSPPRSLRFIMSSKDLNLSRRFLTSFLKRSGSLS